jgi:hypothetical protein
MPLKQRLLAKCVNLVLQAERKSRNLTNSPVYWHYLLFATIMIKLNRPYLEGGFSV